MTSRIVKQQTIYEGRVVTFNIVDVTTESGQTLTREVIQHPGAVAIVALDDDKNIVLVKQHRIAADQYLVELPAGTLEAGETPLDCAIRELQEEAGYKPNRIEAIGGFFVAPSYTTEYIHLFLAQDLVESKLPEDDDESFEIIKLPLSQAIKDATDGRIIDAKTLIGVLCVARLLGD
jgi:ADP-ribose pyrophosphatase